MGHRHKPAVLLSNFGDSSVDLTLVVWVPVVEKLPIMSSIREDIYNEFNKHGIEIPFPQHDLHIKDSYQQQDVATEKNDKE